MKRFWDQATTMPRPDGRHGVLLDGRPLRLPGGAVLATESLPLAEAIAAEWQQAGRVKGGQMRQEDVPLTRLLGTAQERIEPDPAPTIDAIAQFGATDLLCYRAPDHRLAGRQSEAWQPLLDWAAQTLDAPLVVTQGLMPVVQPPQSMKALHAAVARQEVARLAALGVAVPVLGSLVLGLALSLGRLDANEAHRLATLDEAFQAELWGSDPEAEAWRHNRLMELQVAQRFMALARG